MCNERTVGSIERVRDGKYKWYINTLCENIISIEFISAS